MNLSLTEAETKGGVTGVGWMSGQRGPHPSGLPAAGSFGPLLPCSPILPSDRLARNAVHFHNGRTSLW